MSTNLSVIKNPRVQSDQRRLVRRPDVKPNRPLIVILSTVALDAVGIGLIMPVLPGLLRDLVHSNDVTAHYGISAGAVCVDAIACAPVLARRQSSFGGGRSCSSRWPALLSTTPSWRRRLSFGFSISADRGRHHRGDWGGSGAYIADITDGDERARHFGFMSACFGFGMVAGPVLGGLMGAVMLRSSPRQP